MVESAKNSGEDADDMTEEELLAGVREYSEIPKLQGNFEKV
jgi:hypothetical protein